MHVIEDLEMHESEGAVIRREAPDGAGVMLMKARKQVGRHSDIDRAVPTAGKDVDARLPGHFRQVPCSRVLNQVQHDAMGLR
jgi:hypothetical protein